MWLGCAIDTERIAKHPDAKDLNFRCSAALLELDLIEESIAKSQELIKPSKNVEVRARFGGSVTAQHRRCSFWHRLIGKRRPRLCLRNARKVPETLRKLRSTGGSADAEVKADEDGIFQLVRKLHRLRRD